MEGNEERTIRRRMRRIVREASGVIMVANDMARNESVRLTATHAELAHELAIAVPVLFTLLNGFSNSGRSIAPPPRSNVLLLGATDDAAMDFPTEIVINRIGQTGQLRDVLHAQNIIDNETGRRNTHLQQDNRKIQLMADIGHLVAIGSSLCPLAFNHQSSQVVNHLAPYGAGLLGEGNDCAAPAVGLAFTDAMRRHMEQTYPHVGSMGFRTAETLFHAHILLKDVREFALMNEKLHAAIMQLRQEIPLLNNAIFSSTLRHLAIRSEADNDELSDTAPAAPAPAFQKHDRVKHAIHGSGSILQRSRSGKTYGVQFDKHSEPMPRIDPSYLTLITDDKA